MMGAGQDLAQGTSLAPTRHPGVEGKAMAASTDKCCYGWSFNPVLSSSKQKEQRSCTSSMERLGHLSIYIHMCMYACITAKKSWDVILAPRFWAMPGLRLPLMEKPEDIIVAGRKKTRLSREVMKKTIYIYIYICTYIYIYIMNTIPF